MVKDAQVAAILANYISQARSYSGNIMQQDRADSLKLFSGDTLGNEQEGRADIVSQDLADMTNAIIAQLQPAYAGDWLAEFEPDGPDDDEQCKSESAAVNAAFIESNQGFIELEATIMDCLLQANGSIKVWLDNQDEQIVQRFRNLLLLVLVRHLSAFLRRLWQLQEL